MVDPAFKSRIHVTLCYPALDKNTTVKVWRNNLAMVKDASKKDKKAFKIERSEILEFARSYFAELKKLSMVSWNGRYECFDV